MFERLRKKGLALAVSALAVASVGFATPALADDEVAATYGPGEAVLTKVIDAPAGTDTSADEYVFHFAGGGTIIESGDDFSSDGVAQDKATLKKDDVVPTISDVTLTGVQFTDGNTLTNGQTAQAVKQISIEDILEGVVFPHAGVYTYEVTEKSATTALSDGTYINASQAKYKLRIYVVNTNTGTESQLGNTAALTVESVTVQQMKDDNGSDKTGKVDPTYPKATGSKITEVSDGEAPDADENPLAGDTRGRNVDGFTFANEYIKGGEFVVEKLYDGEHSDRTKYSFVELTVYSAAAASPDAHGSCLTYRIEGDGIDCTETDQDDYGDPMKLNGVYSDIYQTNDYMASFNDKGWAKIKANLKEGSIIRITGVFGAYNPEYASEAPNGLDKRATISTSGLVDGMEYYVIERNPGDYLPTGYVYVGEATADPRVDARGMNQTDKLDQDMIDPTDPIPEDQPGYTQATLEEGTLLVRGNTTGSATTVFVVNKLDESKVSPTGILINNLPYILMVGGPLAIFAIMFVSKRRRNAAA